jgi:hypothetical protein
VLKHQVHVVKQRVFKVEELGIHRPAAVFFHQLLADKRFAQHVHRFLERELLVAVVGHGHVAHALVGRGQRAVLRANDGGKPALLDGAALNAQRVIVVRVQLQPAAGLAELPGDEHRVQAKHAVACGQGFADQRFIAHTL